LLKKDILIEPNGQDPNPMKIYTNADVQ